MNTLKSGAQFNRVFTKGKRLAGTYLRAVFSFSQDFPAAVAVVAPKRIDNAPQRNRYKRLIREALRKVKSLEGTQIIFIATPAIQHASLEDISQDIESLLSKIENYDG